MITQLEDLINTLKENWDFSKRYIIAVTPSYEDEACTFILFDTVLETINYFGLESDKANDLSNEFGRIDDNERNNFLLYLRNFDIDILSPLRKQKDSVSDVLNALARLIEMILEKEKQAAHRSDKQLIGLLNHSQSSTKKTKENLHHYAGSCYLASQSLFAQRQIQEMRVKDKTRSPGDQLSP